MPLPATFPIRVCRPIFTVALGFWCLLLIAGTVAVVSNSTDKSRSTPFGIVALPGGEICVQDFSYNLLFLQGIQDHLVPHPYRLEEQGKLIRQMIGPRAGFMPHAYSPVILIVLQPLLHLSALYAYLFYTVFSSLGIVLLFSGYLLPRATCPLQLYALAICALSLCLVTSFELGQSSLMTTSLLGAFWWLLQQRGVRPPFFSDLTLAILFWLLCIKPNVALIPFALLVVGRAWRPLALGIFLLVAAWSLVAGYYGGWWEGLRDYLQLLNHFSGSEIPPIFDLDWLNPGGPPAPVTLFALDRVLVLLASGTIILLGWARRLAPSEQFQAMVWIFLLFSPYLISVENWILCLLVVEGTFFRSRNVLPDLGKLVLLAAIMNVRAIPIFPAQVVFLLKLTLFSLIALEWLQRRPVMAEIDPRAEWAS